jgi:hypothetical protein
VTSALQVALISGAFALLATLLSIRSQFQTKRVSDHVDALKLAESRRFEKEKTVAQFREPLARAAYDLQSRIYNILRQGLITGYYANGDERERVYVVENTVFLIAQYFAWTEIIRQHIQYLDLGEDQITRRMAHLQDDIHSLFLTDQWPRLFRVFAGEQRAIGEKLIRQASHGPECIGYGTFLEADFAKVTGLINYLRNDVRELHRDISAATPRLIAVQNALIDLLAFLDPEFLRFPRSRRSKL